MKKIIIPALILLSSCQSPDYISSNVELKIDQIILTEKIGQNDETDLEFDLFISRPDLNLYQDIEYPEDDLIFTSDLPQQLQPKLMYISEIDDTDPESGNMCDRPRFPHKCSVSIPDEELGKESYTYLIKITFEDGTYAGKEVKVPYPDSLAKPEITSPTKTPARNSKLDISFQDIGATYYEVIVERCGFYNNDGINPCLDSNNYGLKRDKNGGLKEAYPSEYNIPTITVENGLAQVTADVLMAYAQSANYTVNATLESEAEGISTLTKNSDSKTFLTE